VKTTAFIRILYLSMLLAFILIPTYSTSFEYEDDYKTECKTPETCCDMGFDALLVYTLYQDDTLLDPALWCFDRAIEMDEGYARAYYGRYCIYDELGKTKEAMENLRKACDLGFEDACNELKKQ
jgi:tetratricopeptide (TPR) repeat protein